MGFSENSDLIVWIRVRNILLENLKTSPNEAFSSQKESVGKMGITKTAFWLRGKWPMFEYLRNKECPISSLGPLYYVVAFYCPS